MSKKDIDALRKYIKTIRKSKLESKRNCVWRSPGKGISNSLQQLLSYGTLHAYQIDALENAW